MPTIINKPNPDKVVLRGTGLHYEALAGAAITPGMLLVMNNISKVVPHNAVGGYAPLIVAVEAEALGSPSGLGGLGDINKGYELNDRVQYKHLWPGSEIYGIVPPGAAAISIGDYLMSDGAGALVRNPLASVVSGSANGAITWTAKRPGHDGNDITIVLSTASGGGSVTVSGKTITVVPAAAGDTATAVVAQIAASAAASALVTAVAGGTGGSAPGTGTFRTSGAGYPVAFALSAIDNSGGSTAVRIRARLL